MPRLGLNQMPSGCATMASVPLVEAMDVLVENSGIMFLDVLSRKFQGLEKGCLLMVMILMKSKGVFLVLRFVGLKLVGEQNV